MGNVENIDQGRSGDANESGAANTDSAKPGIPRSIRDILSRAAKSNVAGAASQAGEGRVKPDWAAGERAEQPSGAEPSTAARADKADIGNGAAEAAAEIGLEVGGPIPPPPKAKKAPKESVDQLCELLLVGHAMASQFFRVAELQISKVEADHLGVALANVVRHYQWGAMAEKTKDWLLLIGAGCMVYGPRIEHVRKRKAEAKKAKLQANPTGGVQMTPNPAA
jgi:hypothetical protein